MCAPGKLLSKLLESVGFFSTFIGVVDALPVAYHEWEGSSATGWVLGGQQVEAVLEKMTHTWGDPEASAGSVLHITVLVG